jgi:predicted deacylase
MDLRDFLHPGQRTEFLIPVPGENAIMGVLLEGTRSGKTLAVTAGVHGNEYVGIQAVRELIQEIQPADLSGRLILVPLINESGFYQGTHLVPADGKNLNRCFPGSIQGSAAQRMAHTLEMCLYKEADFLLDLHGGGASESMTPLAFFPVGAGAEMEQITRAAASCLSMDFMVQSYADNGLYSYANQRQVPALLLERGDGANWNASQVQACKQNVYEIMDYLGICTAKKTACPPQEIEEARYEEAVEPGFWYCGKRPGESIVKDEILGYLLDAQGKLLQQCIAAYDGVVLYLTHALGVKKGGPLIAYGKQKVDTP